MESSFYKTYFELEKDHWWFKGRRSLVLRLVSAHVSSGKRILDLGSGSGLLVGILQSKGYEAHGLDISEEAISAGRQQGIQNLSVIQGEGIPAADASFDAVLLLDSLEHIKDDAFVIKEVERVLVPGGLAIITVPAYMWLWGVQDEVARHYRRYSMKSLISLISRNSSMRVSKKSYFNTVLFLPIALIRLASRWLGLKGRESDFDIHGNLWNNLLFFIFDTEIRLLDILRYPFGVSILAVLKKHA